MGVKLYTVPFVVGRWYNFHEFGRHLGNVLITIPLGSSEIAPETLWVEPSCNFDLHRSEHRASLDEWNLAGHEDLKLSITLPADTAEAIR